VEPPARSDIVYSCHVCRLELVVYDDAGKMIVAPLLDTAADRPPRKNHGFVLQQRVDLAQPVGPQFVPIGQQDFEQTPLALSALNHTRSLDESSSAGMLVRRIDRRNGRIARLDTAGRRPSLIVSDLRGHFFTAK
jgi:hypothetical protein